MYYTKKSICPEFELRPPLFGLFSNFYIVNGVERIMPPNMV